MIKLSDYAYNLYNALTDVDYVKVNAAIDLIVQAYESGYTIYSCGNGGSAAISDHLVCDCVKGVACDTKFLPRIVSLPSNGSLMTAIANDIGYEYVFSKQLEWSAQPGELLIAISSSGTSKNIVQALKTAKELGLKTILIAGFTGGPKDLTDVTIHIPSTNYGIVEDASQAIMHFIAQSIRTRFTHKDPKDLVL
jgi:phosphoheptose isomerase